MNSKYKKIKYENLTRSCYKYHQYIALYKSHRHYVCLFVITRLEEG
jgi:hypothetical protein